MSIPKSDWTDNRAAIADEMLREDYRTDLRESWVKYINAAYPPGSKRITVDVSTVQKKIVIEVDDTQ